MAAQLKSNFGIALFLGSSILFGFPASGGAQARSEAAYCDQYAQNAAYGRSANGQVVGGAARGALLGTVIGAFAGGPGAGAAIGAGVGALTGGVRRSHSASHIYHEAYRNCMAGNW